MKRFTTLLVAGGMAVAVMVSPTVSAAAVSPSKVNHRKGPGGCDRRDGLSHDRGPGCPRGGSGNLSHRDRG